MATKKLAEDYCFKETTDAKASNYRTYAKLLQQGAPTQTVLQYGKESATPLA